MPVRFEESEPTSCGLVARVKAGQPTFAWDDLKTEYSSPGGVNDKVPANGAAFAEDEDVRRDLRKGPRKAAFYDREALREQIKALQDENRDLSDKEVDLGRRLAKAQITLSGMRTKKRALSEEKILDEAASVVPLKSKACGRGAYLWGGNNRDNHGDGASKGHEARQQQRQEEANFAAQDRIMELEVLNDQLRKGQGKAERKAKSQQAASNATKADMQRVSQRLKAMPKRFTQSLQSLRDEVDRLEREKLSFELAKQHKTLKEADLLASAKRQLGYLGEELASLLDEIDDVEEDRERWKRQLRVESTRAEALRSQRDEALRDLRQRFGDDAVERAAFALFSSSARQAGAGRGGAEWGRQRPTGEVPSEGSEGHDPTGMTSARFRDYDGGEDPKIPVSMVAKALRPAYGPDCDHACYYDQGRSEGDGQGDVAVLLTAEAVEEAVASECGIDCSTASEWDEQGLRLTLEEFVAVAGRLTRRGVAHATRCD